MIILRKRVAQKKEMNFQRSYNLINSVIPVISILSIIFGGASSFIYLKTLNAIDLLYTFNFMSFSIIAISWFIIISYVYMFLHSVSFFSIHFINKVSNHKDILKKNNIVMFYYISMSFFLLLIVLHFYRIEVEDFNYSYWFNGVFIFLLITIFFFMFYQRLKSFYSGGIFNKIASHFFIGFYPPFLNFLASFIIFEISRNESDLYFISLFLFLFIFSLIGNYILLDLKDRKGRDLIPKFFITFIFIIFALGINSLIFNTNFTYTLFYTVGKADSYIKPYKISDDFIRKSGVKLISRKENIFCGKLMLNTNEINIFTQSLKIDEKSKYYRVPSSEISLYQGDIKCKTEDK